MRVVSNFWSPFRLALVVLALILGAQTQASSLMPFRVHDIRVEGLQRLPVQRVFAELTIQSGDVIDRADVAAAVQALFATGNFEDVQLARDGDDLVVMVSERPTVARIDISGNRSINEDQLRRGLSEAGLTEGEVFQRFTLESVAGELERQYVAQGRYGAVITTESVPLPRNRVALDIDIYEGRPARIRDVNIVGNDTFEDSELLAVMELRSSNWLSFIRGDDRYSRERFAGDLENLRSFYLNRGYVNFSVESTQVSVTPDRRRVFLTVNVSEGEQFTVRNVRLAGNIMLDEEELRSLIVMEEGDVFNQQLVTLSNDMIKRRLGNDGFTFAEVQAIEEETGDGETVDVTFYIEPGRKAYVRRINFSGNHKTQDEVLRREMRQFEQAPANTSLIDLSRSRLQRLGYFSIVDTDIDAVNNSDDVIDVNVNVEEQPSGSIGANVGFSDASGVIFGANITQNNWRGSGNRVSFAVSRSRVRDSVSLSHTNPYYTLDGVSRGFNVFYSKIDFAETTVSSFALDRFGVGVNFGYPISEYSRLNFGTSFERTGVTDGDFVAFDIFQYLEENGRDFDAIKGTMSLNTSTLNRGILPDRGWSSRFGLEVAAPGSDVTFYKINWSGQIYFPLTEFWTLRTRADIGFGDGYGDDSELPFFEKFFAGGIGSVRGYRARTLGPRSPGRTFVEQGTIDRRPDPIGGNLLTEASVELIFPTPFSPDSRSVRTFLFADTGSVFQTDGRDLEGGFDADELRTSVGVGLTWLTAIGPLSFNLARPVNRKSGDDTEVFQFSVGQVF